MPGEGRHVALLCTGAHSIAKETYPTPIGKELKATCAMYSLPNSCRKGGGGGGGGEGLCRKPAQCTLVTKESYSYPKRDLLLSQKRPTPIIHIGVVPLPYAWIPHVGTSLQFGFFGRCDAHGRDSSPHAGGCKRTPPPPPSLQYRHRQGTQGQRQVDAGLWTEKVGIAGATWCGAWLGSSHNPGAANNTLLFPRLAHAAPACPGSTQRVSRELLLLPGQGWMTCLSRLRPPKLCLQGAGSDEAFAHSIDTDNIATPASAVLDD